MLKSAQRGGLGHSSQRRPCHDPRSADAGFAPGGLRRRWSHEPRTDHRRNHPLSLAPRGGKVSDEPIIPDPGVDGLWRKSWSARFLDPRGRVWKFVAIRHDLDRVHEVWEQEPVVDVFQEEEGGLPGNDSGGQPSAAGKAPKEASSSCKGSRL